ncbi:MAG: uroporphyrinogen-III synthase [Acidiphilium sp.]|nr:uroporphyrinogen-III synthase [Acidiphilium sp.]MDD4936008.1 uroporphyrinogen-III synthase [Acidiphilium sp.]
MTDPAPPEPLTILVTRPEPGGTATADALRQRGHIPVLAPCLDIEPLPASLPGGCDAIVIASAQALPGLPRALHHIPLFAVGDATAARARAAGFRQVESAGGTASDLAALVTRRVAPHAALLLPCGAGHSLDLAAALRTAGLRVNRRVVYRSRPADALPEAAIAALEAGAIDRVLIYSPATARHFASLVQRAGLAVSLHGVIAIAISPAAARPLARLTFRAIRTAVSPDQDHMLSLLP